MRLSNVQVKVMESHRVRRRGRRRRGGLLVLLRAGCRFVGGVRVARVHALGNTCLRVRALEADGGGALEDVICQVQVDRDVGVEVFAVAPDALLLGLVFLHSKPAFHTLAREPRENRFPKDILALARMAPGNEQLFYGRRRGIVAVKQADTWRRQNSDSRRDRDPAVPRFAGRQDGRGDRAAAADTWRVTRAYVSSETRFGQPATGHKKRPSRALKRPNQTTMILTTCAACAAPLAHDAPRCVRCHTRYCETLNEASNYANCLVTLRRFEETKSLLRKIMPVAQRVIGESHELTLTMRRCYARALWTNTDDLREAVTTLQDASRIARRVMGVSHPLTAAIEYDLKVSQRALARKTPPQGTD